MPRPNKHRYTVHEIEEIKKELRNSSEDGRREGNRDEDWRANQNTALAAYQNNKDPRRPQR